MSAPVLALDTGLDRDLACAARVLSIEAEGLRALADGLDGAFKQALDTIAGVAGRVIVTGMGKSGHVARKIAATLASTGTPALYVHPAEASHGDLGMIVRGDVLLALSNSGNTAELAPVLAYAARLRLPLVAITAGRESPLASAATVALLIPHVAEACPLGLAPTTSTTMMLGLGDALAVALLERRGFSAEDFAALHPGGSLGARLVRVRDIMHTGESIPLIGETTPMAEAIVAMTAKGFGCVGVVDGEGRLVGIITDGDLRRHMSPRLLEATAAAVMTAGPKTIAARSLAAEAVAIMNEGERKITSLFIVEDGRPAGIVHLHDCLRAGVA